MGTGGEKTKRTPMCWKQNTHHTMRNLNITTMDTPDRDRWKLPSVERETDWFWLEKNFCGEETSLLKYYYFLFMYKMS